jgi:hypothetical protein
MDIQEMFDICYAVDLLGLGDETNLTRYVFARRGFRYPYAKIKQLFGQYLQISLRNGYKYPIDYIKDFFQGKYSKPIQISANPISIQINNSIPERKPAEIKIKKPKESSEAESFQASKIIKPVKIKRPESANTGGKSSSISGGIPSKLRNKIIKHKRSSKYYKEMDHKDREIDNKFDYYNYKAKHDESGKFYYDNLEHAADFPFMGKFYNDIDVEFRKIMNKIYNYNRTQTKDKTRWKDEIVFFKEYFDEKIGKDGNDDISTKRLASAVASIMKRLQNKIFETDDTVIIDSLLYFKSKLCLFYNFYRK